MEIKETIDNPLCTLVALNWGRNGVDVLKIVFNDEMNKAFCQAISEYKDDEFLQNLAMKYGVDLKKCEWYKTDNFVELTVS